MSEDRETAEPLKPVELAEPEHGPVRSDDGHDAQRVTSPVMMEGDASVEREMQLISRRSFLWAGVAVAGTWGGWKWLVTRRNDEGIPWPLRRALQTNEEIAMDYFRGGRLSPVFATTQAREPRVNGMEGMSDDFDPAQWQLRVQGLQAGPDTMKGNWDTEGEEPALLLTLADIKAFPKVEMITELKCIEGWSQVVHWGGARLADFTAKYLPATRSGNPTDVKNHPDDLPRYVSLKTPDEGYYVGLDRESALHPQTLLCYEMNGQPLTSDHGAPLRLAIPVKYGIKNLKRIGTLRFTDERPADYWAEQGYDWYSGH